MDPYEKIAPFYDCEHAEFRDDIELYLQLLPQGPVLEVGCGTGRITEALAQAGFTVLGVDRSDAMLARARSRLSHVPRVHLVHGAIADVSLDMHFQSALLPLNTLWHFPGTEDQLAALRAIHVALVPDGMLVVDLTNPLTMADRGARGEHRQHFRHYSAGGSVTGTASAWDDEAEQQLHLSLTYDQIDAGGRNKRATAELELRYIYRYELELLLLHAGFRLHQLFGSYDLEPYSAHSPSLIAVAHKS
jgi:SAM-dependent methyltransferase